MERRSARTPGPKEWPSGESLGFSLPHIPDPDSVLEKTTTQKCQEERQKKPLPRACLVVPFQRPRKGAAQQGRTFFRQELLYANHSSPQNKNKPKKSYGFNPIHRNKERLSGEHKYAPLPGWAVTSHPTSLHLYVSEKDKQGAGTFIPAAYSEEPSIPSPPSHYSVWAPGRLDLHHHKVVTRHLSPLSVPELCPRTEDLTKAQNLLT